MPLGPGTDLFEVEDKAEESSAEETAERSRVGRGGGLLGCAAAIGAPREGKKRSARAASISVGMHVTSPEGERKGWTCVDFGHAASG